MTPRLPVISAAKLLKILRSRGFEVARQSGSHVVLRHPDGRRATVPVHQSRDLGRGILRRIIKDAELTRDDVDDAPGGVAAPVGASPIGDPRAPERLLAGLSAIIGAAST